MAVAAVAFAPFVARGRAALLTLIVAVDAIVLFAVPEFAAPRSTKVDLAPVAYLRRHLGTRAGSTRSARSHPTTAPTSASPRSASTISPRGLRAVRAPSTRPGGAFTGFPSAGPSAESELLRHLGGYRSAGVRYVLAPARQSLPQSPDRLRLVFRSPSTWIYRLAGTSPYYRAPGCRMYSSSPQSVSVVCPRPSTLVRRETWFAGWTARVDGKPDPSVAWTGSFRPSPSRPEVTGSTFSFTPPGMSWAVIGLLAGCALLCLPTVSRMVRRRQDAPEQAVTQPEGWNDPAGLARPV